MLGFKGFSRKRGGYSLETEACFEGQGMNKVHVPGGGEGSGLTSGAVGRVQGSRGRAGRLASLIVAAPHWWINNSPLILHRVPSLSNDLLVVFSRVAVLHDIRKIATCEAIHMQPLIKPGCVLLHDERPPPPLFLRLTVR